MGSITNRTISDNAIVNAITAKKIWGETDLQYYFGDDKTLALDTEFADVFKGDFTGKPDAAFAFTGVATAAFSSLSNVSGLHLTQTTDTTIADLVLVSSPNDKAGDLEGFFQFPDMSHRAPGDSWQLGAFNSGMPALTAAPETGGGQYANWTIFHEIGHSLGLKHTHQEKEGLPPLAVIGEAMDNERYSVMSYNSASDSFKFGHAVTYMALDIAALQSLYGMSEYAVGNSGYTLLDAKQGPLDLTEGSMEIGRALACIWDGFGTDAISYGGAKSRVMINLNDATLNTGGLDADMTDVIAALKSTDYFDDLSKGVRTDIINPWNNAGGSWSQVLIDGTKGLTGNGGGYTIAHGATIENAVGGLRGDLLIGNEVSNVVRGAGGNDTILASGGDDRIYGGAGHDILYGGEGADSFYFSAGKDTIMDFNAEEGDVMIGWTI